MLLLQAMQVIFFILYPHLILANPSNYSDTTPLSVGWSSNEPYAYLQDEEVPTSLSGLDVELLRIIAKKTGLKLHFQRTSWEKQLEALRIGQLDIGMGATFTTDRLKDFYFSKPYRFDEDTLFILKDKISFFQFKTLEELFSIIQKYEYRIAILQGFVFSDPKINAFISDPKNNHFIIKFENREELLHKLKKREIVGFFTNKISGSSLIFHAHLDTFITEVPLHLKNAIHLIFSKKTVSPDTVLQFDQAIKTLLSDEKYQHILSWYLYPTLLIQIIDTHWFKLIDILGTAFFAISGVIIANSRKTSLLSAFVYAIIPSLGGGILRDIIFGIRPIEALHHTRHIFMVITIVLAGFILSKLSQTLGTYPYFKKRYLWRKPLHKHFELLLSIFDALGLSAFTVSGVMAALVAKVEPLWLWGPFFSFVTGAFGTILRDILCKNKKLEDIEGEIYSEVAILWGLFLSIGLHLFILDNRPDIIRNLLIITLAGVFLTRMLLVIFKVPNVYFK